MNLSNNMIVKSSLLALVTLTASISANAGFIEQCASLELKIDELKDGKAEMKRAKSDAIVDALFSDDEDEYDDADADYIAGDIMHDVINDELKEAKHKYRMLGCHHWD